MKHALEIPYAALEELKKDYKLTTIRGGVSLYTGSPILPAALKPYASTDYSYTRWIEDEQNAMVLPPHHSSTTYTLRPYQQAAADAIALAYSEDAPGFILSDHRGVGKTLSVIAGVTLTAQAMGFGNAGKAKVLIICSKAKVAAWKEDLHRFPKSSAYCRFLVMDHGQMKRLLTAPANARISHKASVKSKQTAVNGKSTIAWDFIVLDDFRRNGIYPHDNHSLEAAALAQLDKPYHRGRTPFTIFTSNGLYPNPLAYSLPSKILSRALTSPPKEIPPKEWGIFLDRNNFSVALRRGRYSWGNVAPTSDKHSVARDTALLKQAFRTSPLVMTRSLLEVGSNYKTTYLALPLVLTSGRLTALQGAWETFRKTVSKNPSQVPERALQRLILNTNSLKVAEVVAAVQELASEEESVYLRVDSMKVAQDYRERLLKKKVACEVMTGKAPNEEKELWALFKAGHVQVLITTECPTVLAQDTQVTKSPFSPIAVLTSPVAEDYHNELKMLFHSTPDPKVYLPYFIRSYEEKVVEEFITYSETVNRLSHKKALATTLKTLKTLVAEGSRGTH